MSADNLKGFFNVSGVDEKLESDVLAFKEKYRLSTKSMAVKMLLREGIDSAGKRKVLRIAPTG